MWKRLCVLLLCLTMAFPALAEEIPTLPGLFTLDALPEGLTFEVYTGPGTRYHQAAGGKAKVSTNGPIQCYGRVGDGGWMLIRYEVSTSQVRVGYIDLSDYPDLWQRKREVELAAEVCQLSAPVEITDDPSHSHKPLGTVSGLVTVLAWRGNEWAYVEGTLDGSGEPVRGFIPRTALNGALPLADVAVSPVVGDRFTQVDSHALNLPEDALAEDMEVFPLQDGSFLIAYRCSGSDRVWLRVISATGKKLWAKSVPRRYLHQITLTETGFVCETFDNSECDSGMRYTYTCKGRKWAAKSVAWISEPDRAYADNTAHFTLLRHTFGEGGQPMPIELTNRANGAEAVSAIETFAPFLYEVDGELLMLDDWHAGLTLRRFAANLTELTNLPVPEGISAPYNVHTADHSRNAVYFFTGYAADWRMWRLDRETLTFADVPVTITLPYGCTDMVALSANAAGTHDVLLHSAFGSYFAQLAPDGTLQLHQALPGRVVWITRLEDARLMLILMDSAGEFHLLYYEVCEG